MGLYVSTTGTDVAIPELGFTLTHPSTDYALSDQFSAEDIRGADSLTTSIRTGVLVWKKTSGGTAEISTDYDPDYLESEELNTGLGYQGDRVVTFKDLNVMTLPTKSGVRLPINFSGNPKKATVTFVSAFADANYTPTIIGVDVRSWSVESVTAGGFVINSNANQALTGSVYWSAIKHGETV